MSGWIYEGRCPVSHATLTWRPLASCEVCLGTCRVSFETAPDVYGATALFQTQDGRVQAKRVESTTAPRYDAWITKRQAHPPAIGEIMPNDTKPPPEHVMQFFAHAHLPGHLAEVSRPFAELADKLVLILPANAERTKALDRLLEAKDAAVRDRIAKERA